MCDREAGVFEETSTNLHDKHGAESEAGLLLEAKQMLKATWNEFSRYKWEKGLTKTT